MMKCERCRKDASSFVCPTCRAVFCTSNCLEALVRSGDHQGTCIPFLDDKEWFETRGINQFVCIRNGTLVIYTEKATEEPLLVLPGPLPQEPLSQMPTCLIPVSELSLTKSSPHWYYVIHKSQARRFFERLLKPYQMEALKKLFQDFHEKIKLIKK